MTSCNPLVLTLEAGADFKGIFMKLKPFLLITIPFSIIIHLVQITNCYSEPSNGLKVGVVDISAVFEEYSKRKLFDKQLKEIEKEYQDTVSEKRSEIKKLKEEISLMDMGNENRLKKEEIIEKKAIDLEVFAKFTEQSLLKKYKEFFEIIYLDVSKEVENFGNEYGFDLIIKNEEPELKSGEISDLQFKIGIKTVLYYSKTLDITPQIIKRLNNQISKK